jgi:hypothetical protein
MVISDDDEIHEIPSPQQGKQPHKPQLAEVSIRTDCQNSDAYTKLCAGYHLSFPKGQQAHTSYPFTLHTLMSLPWYYSTCKDTFYHDSLLYIGSECRNNSDRPEHQSRHLDAALRSGLQPPGFARSVFHTYAL